MNLSSMTPNLLESSILKMTNEKFFIPNLEFSRFIPQKNRENVPLNTKHSQSLSNPNASSYCGLEFSIMGALTILGSSPLRK